MTKRSGQVKAKTDSRNLYDIILRMTKKKKSVPDDGNLGEVLGPYYSLSNMRMNRMAFAGSQV